jgi:16S rRNA (guanine527-N7)-methyltransferase
VDPAYDRFVAACTQLDLDPDPARYELLCRYAALVREWNRRVNLISRRDIERIFTYHIVDSIAIQRFVPPSSRVADIGSGAGLPGIPLAVVRPDLDVVLLESTQKRAQFLRHAIGTLPVPNTRVLGERAESTTPLDCGVVVSRLTGPLADTLRYAARHRRPDGLIVLYKTPAGADEFACSGRILARLGLQHRRTEDVVLPLTDITRRFVFLGASR